MTMADNSRAINRVFTRGVLGELLNNGTNEVFDYVVSRYTNDPENKTHGELFSEIYAHLGKEKRNEYYYLNTLLNKLLIGIHSVNTTTALSQIQIGNHIADFIMINGAGSVYEIKSDLDNFNRLHDQLGDYFKAFSKVSVLSSIHELDKIAQMLSEFGNMGDSVGIYVLSEKDTIFSKIHSREPKQFDEQLEHSCIFKLLRKREYENILMLFYGVLPIVAPVFHFRACFEQFQQIPILTAQELAFKQLKERNRITKTTFENVQDELKSIVYFSGMSRKLPDIEKLLQTTYRG
jgi:hypothetical protein